MPDPIDYSFSKQPGRLTQDRPSAQSFLRQPDGTWSMMGVNGLEASLRLRSLQVEVPLAEIYYRIQFPDRPPPVSTPNCQRHS